MQCLNVLGFMEYYFLDGDRIYNSKQKKYMKEVGEYRFKIRTKDGKQKSVTIKEIYKRLYNKVFCVDNVERLCGEQFREIEGTSGNYFISNYGRVLSYVSNHAIILKPTITNKGYERLQITIDGQKYNKFVHCLVAAAWLGQPQSLEQEIHHIDFNQRNNNCNNLQYVYKNEHVKKHVDRREKEQCQNITVTQIKEV